MAKNTTRPIGYVSVRVDAGPGAGLEFTMIPLPVVIGRGDDADVRLPDADDSLSRRHLVLSMTTDRLQARDVSRNGTFLGNVPMAHEVDMPLPENCSIRLGRSTIITVKAYPSKAAFEEISRGVRPQSQRRVRLLTLGRAQVQVDGNVVPDEAWQSRKALELFCYLAQQGGHHEADALCAQVWGNQESVSRATLQSSVSRLRRALREVVPGIEPIQNERGLYCISPKIEVELDSKRLEALCARPPEPATLQQAVALYHGPFLHGWSGDWIDRVRTRLEHLFLNAQESLAALYQADRTVDALAHYQRVLQIDPCRESAHVGVVRCLQQLGRRDEAVRQCLECGRLLQKHLNLSPGPEIHTLYKQLVDADAFDKK